MKEAIGTAISGAVHYGKTVLAAGVLAVLITACGGEGDSAVDNNKPAQTADTGAEQLKIAPEELPQALLDGKYAEIYKGLSDTFKEQLTEAELTSSAAEFLSGIEYFKNPTVLKHNGVIQRTWVSNTEDKGLTAVFDDNYILGLLINELASYPETDNTQTAHKYDWPLRGDWLVIWGGKNALVNYHYEHESQRYAYDLVQTKDGFSFSGDPLKNESYYAFGQPILAPAAGTVVSVVNDIADNDPVGVMNDKVPAGNAVVIDHGGEYSILAHFKKGSITVKVGDKVASGDPIGLVGNSGNSSEAHLHYQVSDGAELFDSLSIPINWRDGSTPVQGELVTGR